MPNEIRDVLLRQLDLSWRLARHHLDGLSTEECLWAPASAGLRLVAAADGRWTAEMPVHERYDLGPASIGWLTWHMGYWWSMVLDRTFGAGTLTAAQVVWPGSGSAAAAWITAQHDAWRRALAGATEAEMRSHERTRWPFADRSFADLAAWVNVELVKSAAEIGYARFLHAVREDRRDVAPFDTRRSAT
jgi:hypothetical protein